MNGKLTLFKCVSVANGLLFLFLFAQLLLTPAAFVSGVGLEPSEATSILGRRVSILMLGVAVLSVLSRNLPHSAARQSICISTGTTLIGLAIMSGYELCRGTVNASMWQALVIEATFGLCFWLVFLRHLHPKQRADVVRA